MEATEKNIVLISGSDPATAASAAAAEFRRFAGETPDPFAQDILRQRDDQSVADLINQLVYSLSSPSFMGGRKTVWLQNFEGFSAEGAKTSATPEAKAFERLCELLQKGLPSDMALIMNGPDVDRRKRLFKVCSEQGTVIFHDKPDVTSRTWQAEMLKLVRQQAQAKGVTLPSEVAEYLVGILGTDTLRIDSELEKLICYCGGPREPLTLDAAREICIGAGEIVPWALLDALGTVQAEDALRILDTLLRQEKDPDAAALGYVLQLAGRLRQLLQIRVYMGEQKFKTPNQLKSAVENMDADRKKELAAEGLEILASHPYRVFMLAKQAVCFSGNELVDAFIHCRDANIKLVTSGAAPRVLLEQLTLAIATMRTQAHRSN